MIIAVLKRLPFSNCSTLQSMPTNFLLPIYSVICHTKRNNDNWHHFDLLQFAKPCEIKLDSLMIHFSSSFSLYRSAKRKRWLKDQTFSLSILSSTTNGPVLVCASLFHVCIEKTHKISHISNLRVLSGSWFYHSFSCWKKLLTQFTIKYFAYFIM